MSKLLYFAVLSVLVALCYRYFCVSKATVSSNSPPSEWDDIFLSGESYNKSVVKVTDGVYVATYYAMANVIMIEGKDGIIIVDTTESRILIKEVINEFRKITDKPLKAIILTHFHPDHIRGFEWLVEDAGHHVDIYIHRLAARELSKTLITAQGSFMRIVRQLGFGLKKKVTNSGVIGAIGRAKTEFLTPKPTHIVDDIMDVNIAGIRLQLIHTPSETVDHISVWIPDKKVLMPGDSIFRCSFPNIGTIRGDFPRSAVDWFTSIDKMRYLRPSFLVMGHTLPLSGEDEIFEFMTNFRDAIQFVHDQTVRLTNQGLHVSDIVRQVKLPPSLASKSYLQGNYGTVEWSVRAIHANYTGWFSGEAHELNPLTIKERAEKMRELLEGASDGGGVDSMIRNSHANAKKSMENFDKTGEFLFIESQWALEVANTALVLSQEGSTEHERAKKAKIDALVIMARYSVSMMAKNYYLTCAAELDGSFSPPDVVSSRKTTVNKMLIGDLMSLFAKRVNPQKCDSFTKITALLHFTDINKTFGYMLRNCVIELVDDEKHLPTTYDVKLKMTSQVWRDLATKERGGFGAYMSGDLEADGSMMSFKHLTDVLN